MLASRNELVSVAKLLTNQTYSIKVGMGPKFLRKENTLKRKGHIRKE